MNFRTEFIKGQKSKNIGLPLGPGLEEITQAINGIQRGTSTAIASSPKVGKSTYTDCAYILGPYLQWLKEPFNIKIVYFSFEMDRVSKEYDFACWFLHNEYGINKIQLPEGVLYQNARGDEVDHIYLSSEYLRGRLQDTEGRTILCDNQVKAYLILVYENRLVPLFGEYDEKGHQIKKGIIEFHGEADNPTGLNNRIKEIAEERGTFEYQTYVNKLGESKTKIVSYIPNDPEEYVIFITDTVRKLKKERGFNIKENVDKYLEYTTFWRNLCNYIFINIIHLNRDLADVQKLRYMGDNVHPEPSAIKDSGNVSEESSFVFTLFSPCDPRYNLEKHFGLELKDSQGNYYYPNLRTIHLVEARLVQAPRHFRVLMEGNVKSFKKFN